MLKRLTLLLLLQLTITFSFAQATRSDTIHVAHYDITLSVMDFTNKIISGNTCLTVVAKMDNLSSIVLDLQSLMTDSVKVNSQAASFTQGDNKLFITTPTLKIGDTTLVNVYYHGTPVTDSYWGGFYFSGGYAFNLGVGFRSYPHNFGRVWFPCIDDFTDRSTYTTHIITEPGKMAVCGGTLTDTATVGDNAKMWTWQLNEPIPTYLASIAVGDYRLYADTFQGMQAAIPIHIYAQPNTYANVAGSFINIKKILKMYEEHFGPYRWPRIGYVLVNFTGGAMEHATNIAYPNVAVNGSTDYESLYAHELFHSWFGDLVTCKRAEEMWINEGFTTYSEAMVDELLHNNYKEHIRKLHRETLTSLSNKDGGLYALDDVPQSITYGKHSYDKGALVVHTLRNYMGDSLFFSSIQQLLSHHEYQTISSKQLFDYLSEVSHTDLTDFYNGWVHQPGFLHFSVDSLTNQDSRHYRVYLRQKLYGATQMANSNKIDLTFVGANRQLYTVPAVPFSGETGYADIEIPFHPVFTIVDIDDKLADAIIDYTTTITEAGSYTGDETECTLHIETLQDTLLARIEHNWVAPDEPQQLPEGIARISDSHYWNVYLTDDKAAKGYLQFHYLSSGTALDHQLMNGYTQENLKLLYRPNTASAWQIIPATRMGSLYNGTLKTTVIASGQYCLGVGDKTATTSDKASSDVKIYPNPAKNIVTIQVNVNPDFEDIVTLSDTAGRILKMQIIKNGTNRLSVKGLSAGVYILNGIAPNSPISNKTIIVGK